MDPQTRQQLEERVRQEVALMLTEGMQPYLQSLSHLALVEVLENELRFLGLYAHSDTEAPAIIHALLERELDEWCHTYLVPHERDTGSLTQLNASRASGVARSQETYYMGFTLPGDQLRIQRGHDQTKERTR
jgi:hypothetical protein